MDGGRYDHKRVGKLLRQQLPAGALIMTRSGRIGFYADHPRVDIPQADLEAILRTAREQKVRYLVVTGDLVGLRPQLALLIMPLISARPGLDRTDGAQETLPGLVRRLTYVDPASYGVVVYEFIR
jgi:hypothetical protein